MRIHIYDIQPNSYRVNEILTRSYYLKRRKAERITRNTIWELTLSTGCFYFCQVSDEWAQNGVWVCETYAESMCTVCDMKAVPLQPSGKRFCLLSFYIILVRIEPPANDSEPPRKHSSWFATLKEAILMIWSPQGRSPDWLGLPEKESCRFGPHKANPVDLDPDEARYQQFCKFSKVVCGKYAEIMQKIFGMRNSSPDALLLKMVCGTQVFCLLVCGAAARTIPATDTRSRLYGAPGQSFGRSSRSSKPSVCIMIFYN